MGLVEQLKFYMVWDRDERKMKSFLHTKDQILFRFLYFALVGRWALCRLHLARVSNPDLVFTFSIFSCLILIQRKMESCMWFVIEVYFVLFCFPVENYVWSHLLRSLNLCFL